MRVLIAANDAPIVSLVFCITASSGKRGAGHRERKTGQPGHCDLTVPFTVTGTGTVGVDFTPASGSFVFGAGKTTASAVITVLDDTVIEQSETVIVTLDNSAAFQKGSIGSTTLEIRDNDTVKVNFQSQVTSVWRIRVRLAFALRSRLHRRNSGPFRCCFGSRRFRWKDMRHWDPTSRRFRCSWCSSLQHCV